MAQNQKVDFSISSENALSFGNEQSLMPWFIVPGEAGMEVELQDKMSFFCSENFAPRQ